MNGFSRFLGCIKRSLGAFVLNKMAIVPSLRSFKLRLLLI